jgi:hypothetical protein
MSKVYSAEQALKDWAHGEWKNPNTHCVVEELECVPEDFCGIVLKIPAWKTDDKPILYRATFGDLKVMSNGGN